MKKVFFLVFVALVVVVIWKTAESGKSLKSDITTPDDLCAIELAFYNLAIATTNEANKKKSEIVTRLQSAYEPEEMLELSTQEMEAEKAVVEAAKKENEAKEKYDECIARPRGGFDWSGFFKDVIDSFKRPGPGIDPGPVAPR